MPDKVSDDVIDNAIKSSIRSMQIYSKVAFDNAKDTQELIEAADAAHYALMDMVRHKIRKYVEEILIDKISQSDDGSQRFVVKIGNELFNVERQP